VEAVQSTVERNGLERSRVRLTITGGDLNMLQSTGASQQDPTVIVVTQPPTPYPDAFFEEGVCVVFASGRVNPWSTDAGHKTLNYWPRIHALQEAAMTKAGEALWLTPDAHVASGSVSNLFLVSGETLVTPPARGEAESPVLPGITRAAVIELAETLNLDVQLRQVSMDEFLAADEVFLTNSSWQVLPVSSFLVRTRSKEHGDGEEAVGIEHRPIGEGTAGSVTLDIRTALLAMIDRETG
jgi:branched-chain amino acid aminotransferase